MRRDIKSNIRSRKNLGEPYKPKESEIIPRERQAGRQTKKGQKEEQESGIDMAEAETKRVLHNFTRYLLSDIAVKKVRNFLCSAFRTSTILNQTFITFARHIFALINLAMAAPLRRIVARELCEFQPDPRNPKYLVYSLIDTLECGHSQDVYLFNGLQDLTNPYIDSPAIRAKRHRCRPCEMLLAKKKPASVPLPAITKTA